MPIGIAGGYYNLRNRPNAMMVELQKLRHREAQRRYRAKKKRELLEDLQTSHPIDQPNQESLQLQTELSPRNQETQEN